VVAYLHLVVSDKAVSSQIEIVSSRSSSCIASRSLQLCLSQLAEKTFLGQRPRRLPPSPRRRPNRQLDFTRAFVGLWCDAKGDCQRAHESTQDEGRAAGHSSAPDREDMIISVWTGIVCERDQS
jgi:hypothetical protein